MTQQQTDLSNRLQRLLIDTERAARPSHILRAIESAAVSLSDHAQENLSDLIEWLGEAEALAQMGQLGEVTAKLEAQAQRRALVEEAIAEAEKAPPKKKTKKRKGGVELVGPPKPGSVRAAKLFIDGGSRGNPGPSGIGIVMQDGNEEVLWTHGEAIGEGTNNNAEYIALIRGLTGAIKAGVHEIDVFSDADLVVKQMGGQYKVKSLELRPLWQEAQGLSRQFRRFRMRHIPRAKNKTADALVNQALDEATGRA